MEKELDYTAARKEADDIETTANKVDSLFQEVEAEKNKAQRSWEGSAANEAFELFDHYRSNFQAFINEIRENAKGIKTTCDEYINAEQTNIRTTEAASRIQR